MRRIYIYIGRALGRFRLPRLASRGRRSVLQRTATHAVLVVWRTKAFWLRAFLCWMIGAGFFLVDDAGNYDLRFQMRPPRPPQNPIVLLEVGEREWVDLVESQGRHNVLRMLKEITQATDSSYWRASIWRALLDRVLAGQPAAVGVAFYFGDESHATRMGSLVGKSASVMTNLGRSSLEDPRIIWSAELDAAGRVAVPGLATAYDRNVAIKTLRPDDDGILRRFYGDSGALPHHGPHLALRLADAIRPASSDTVNARLEKREAELIDFSGPAGTFPSYSFRDVLAGRISPTVFKGKAVVIGPRDGPLGMAITPLGRMTRAETLANVIDDAASRRWIQRAPKIDYLVILAVLLAFSIWILSTYPQSVALAFFICMGLLWSAASAWAFDVKFVWLPMLAPGIQTVATYIIFLSYQLARNEQKAWRLEQERRYFTEIESLKNNFVSMMSHDLKTPIAKIQAIAGRALTSVGEFSDAGAAAALGVDLRELLRASDDLHRYIRSILQVTKVEAREFQIMREPIDVNDAIRAAVERLRPLADEKEIKLEERLEPMFSIEADSTLIQEVVLNLVENAIKYTPKKGQVAIDSHEIDDQVRVTVEDTGPGIDRMEQAGVWGKFTRGRKHSEDAKGPSGTGLGLYLVKYFVELHGGKVFLDSEIGRGTKIGFLIPVTADAPTALPGAG